jgi:hypothetical protein
MNRIAIVSFWSSIRSGVSRLDSTEPQLPTLTSNEGQQIDTYSTFFGNYLLSAGNL